MKTWSAIRIVACIMALFCLLLAASCNGFTVTPDDGGGVTITPGGDSSSGEDGKNDENTNVEEIHSHTYQLITSTESYSCTEGGIRTWKCACGDSFEETVAAPGHDIRSFEGKEPTCVLDGYKDYEKCIRGNCTYTTYEVIPALGHDLQHYEDIQPTCTTSGVTDRVECKRDGCSYSTETKVSALGHVRQTIEGKAATCTSSGFYSYEICTRSGCTDEGLVSKVVIDALGHDNLSYDGKAATCTEFGWNDYTVCQRCDHSTYKQIDAKGHSFDHGSCSICGYVDPGHSHEWDEGEVLKMATCTSAGSIRYTCEVENCGETKTESVSSLGHDNKSYAAKAATCTEEGWYAYTECQRCGYSTFASIPSLGHSYDSGVITVSPTCTESGICTYTCIRGDRSFATVVEPHGHEWSEWTVGTEPTCESSGQEIRVCIYNATHVETRSIVKLGHAYSDWTVTTDAECEKNGEERKICGNDSSHIIIRAIPAHGHTVDSKTGKCITCDKTVNPPLDTPKISKTIGSVVYWGAIDGAVKYEIAISNAHSSQSTTIVSTTDTFFDLEPYYGVNTALQLFITAIPAENAANIKSAKLQYIFDIPTGSIASYKGSGLGQSVNLLEGYYTDYASVTSSGGSVSIFNEVLWNRLTAVRNPITKEQHKTDIIYSESMEGYTEQLSKSIGNKFSVNTSVGYAGLAKVTAGYSFEVNNSYSKKTYNETQAIFYDMTYTYRGYQVGVSDITVLQAALSEQFLEDARDLENGIITAEQFINKYGTHVITSGIYGASFRAHFESLMNKNEVTDTFGTSIQDSISASIGATIYGVSVEVGTSTESKQAVEHISTKSTANTCSKFSIVAIGGNEPSKDMLIDSLAGCASAYNSWAETIQDESEFRLIDVPDGSLYFVWDFLGDDYAEAKSILNQYFYTRCDDQCEGLKDKINGMYKDFCDFDDKTGTLTFDLSGLQEVTLENTGVDGILYMDGKKEIFNGTTGIVTIYPKYSGKDVNKVVFKGGYLTRDLMHYELIENMFEFISIKFDDDWTRDIVVEFENFAYIAPTGYSALDFSEVKSDKVTIIVTGNSYIKGGDGASSGEAGLAGIDATGKNLLIEVIEGTGLLEVIGGNGVDGAGDGADGSDGGIGIIVEHATINMMGQINIFGGVGGNGVSGSNGDKGSPSFSGHDDRNAFGGGANGGNGTDGANGGNAGKGGYAYDVSTLIVNGGTLTATGGQSGNGGNGGNGGAGGKGQEAGGWGTTAGNGGNGGDGGNGGNTYIVAASDGCESIVENGGTLLLVDGAAGTVGKAGFGGARGAKGMHCDASNCGQFATSGNDGKNGYAGSDGKAGLIVSIP